MGLIVPTTIQPERADQPLPSEWFVGIDWGSQPHQVCVLDRDRHLGGARLSHKNFTCLSNASNLLGQSAKSSSAS
jgi:hypothetical protein